jgi:hypothetical protein
MSLVILCRGDSRPCLTWLAADHDGRHVSALERLLDVPIALPLHDGIQLYCGRDCLLFGLVLARRALARCLAEPSLSELTLDFDRPETTYHPRERPLSADFLLARTADDVGLVDLTASDIERWMSWLWPLTRKLDESDGLSARTKPGGR